jgi:hypothetical protein
VERAARDAEALRGVRADGAVAELLPAAAAPFFSAQRVAPGGGSAQLPAGFAVVIVVEGAGTLAGLDVTRGDAVLVPMPRARQRRRRPRGHRLPPPEVPAS